MRQRQLFRLFVAGLLMVLLTPTRALALNNGDTFTSYTTEGISMTFQIISTTDMTCRVYGYYNSSTSSYTPAIDNFTSGKVTIPSSPSGYKVDHGISLLTI